MNSKKTKKALIASILSMLMCMSMLVGSTFAWFTDTAVTSVNTIQAGKLDVGIEMYSYGTENISAGNESNASPWGDAEGKTLSFLEYAPTSAAKFSVAEVLWEPGATYMLQPLRIVNKENLALKFRLAVNGISGDNKLAEVLEVYFVQVDESGIAILNNAEKSAADIPTHLKGWTRLGTLADVLKNPNGVAHGIILPKGTTPEEAEALKTAKTEIAKEIEIEATSGYQIALRLKDGIGNQYQGMQLKGLTFTVYATQYNYESDSFAPDYDINSGSVMAYTSGTYVLDEDVFVANAGGTAVSVSGKGTVLDIISGSIYGGSGGENIAVKADQEATVNIKDGKFTVGCNADGQENHIVYAGEKSVINISGGTFTVDCNADVPAKSAIFADGGTINITNGTFIVNRNEDTLVLENSGNATGSEAGSGAVGVADTDESKNALDVLFGVGTDSNNQQKGTIVIKGGTFVNWNPEGSAFIDANQVTITNKAQTNDDVWYTVRPNNQNS